MTGNQARNLTGTWLALALLSASAACTWNVYDRVIAVDQCPTFQFLLTGEKELHGLRVLYRARSGREDVYWRIAPVQGRTGLNAVCYGVTPRGFRQVTPEAGPPERLEPGRYLVETEGSGNVGWVSFGFVIDEAGKAGPLVPRK